MKKGELERRILRLEEAAGLRPPRLVFPNLWDVNGHYWGDWKDPFTGERLPRPDESHRESKDACK